MTTFEDVYAEAAEVVDTAFALAATSPVYRDIRAGRLDWRGLIAKWQASAPGGLQPPYVVMAFGEMFPAPEWSAMDNDFFWLPLQIFYIDLALVSIEAIDTKMQALLVAFRRDTAFTNFYVPENGTINNLASNPANEYFLGAGTQLVAGMFSVSLLTAG